MKRRPTTAVAFYLALAVGVCGGALAANLHSAQPLSPARAALAPSSTAPRGGAAGARPVPAAPHLAQSEAAAQQSSAAPASASVSTLPQSGSVHEASMAIDSTGVIYVTAPGGLSRASSDSASPVWKSSDGGATWSGPTSTETGAATQTGVGGVVSDIAVGPADSVYVTSSWDGNTAMAVSTDHGASFTQLPIGHLTPVDDRPWLYYDPGTSALYMDWDGAGGVHVGKALVNADPTGQLVFEQDSLALVDHTDRGCDVCAPGNVVVDRNGFVHAAFAGTGGVGVVSSADGLTQWSQSYVPGTIGDNVSNNYQVLRADSDGNLYLVWTQTADTGHTAVYLSYMKQGASGWHAPIAVSTSNDAVFGTLAVVSPGVVDVAYYGSDYGKDPNTAPDSASWNLYLAQVKNVFGSPSIRTADLLPDLHHGPISTGSLNPGGGTTIAAELGSFFSMAVDASGLADIVTAVHDGDGTKLAFVHEQPAAPPTPGPAFVLQTPAPATAARARFPFPSYALPHNHDIAAMTPGSDAAAAGAAVAAAPSTDTGTTGRPSGPKYPDGVAVSTPAAPGGDGGGHAPPLWAYLLAGGGATAGRFVLKRGRG